MSSIIERTMSLTSVSNIDHIPIADMKRNYRDAIIHYSKVRTHVLMTVLYLLLSKVGNMIFYKKKISERVLLEIGERRNLLGNIMEWKIKLIGHLIRHNSFIRNIFERRISG